MTRTACALVLVAALLAAHYKHEMAAWWSPAMVERAQPRDAASSLDVTALSNLGAGAVTSTTAVMGGTMATPQHWLSLNSPCQGDR